MSKKKPIAPPHGVWQDEHGPVRIMAVVEGYVVFRRPNASPGLLHIAEFAKRFKPTQETPA